MWNRLINSVWKVGRDLKTVKRGSKGGRVGEWDEDIKAQKKRHEKR